MCSRPGRGSDAFPSSKTARVHHAARRCGCVAARGAPRPPVPFALLRCFADFAREAERRLHRLMIMDHRGLVAAKDRVRLGPGSQPDLDAAASRKVLAPDDIENKLHVLVPVGALFLRDRCARDVKGEFIQGGTNAALDWENTYRLNLIALK